MGKYLNGINGPFVGKIGNVIGSSWRGIPYMKSRGLRTKPATEGEKQNRFVFGMTQQWLYPLTAFLRVGFKDYTPTNQGVNAAKSYLYKHALIKDGYDSVIDPTLVKVSHGSLPLPDKMEVELNNDNELIFTWDTKSESRDYEYDQVILLAYDIEETKAEMSLNGRFRKTGWDVLDINGLKNFVVYAAFVSADRTSQSDSIFLGTFTDVEPLDLDEWEAVQNRKKNGNKPANSAETAPKVIAEDSPDVEEVPSNQLNLFESLDEVTKNSHEALKPEIQPMETQVNNEKVLSLSVKEDTTSLKPQAVVSQAAAEENITNSQMYAETQATEDQFLTDDNSENKSLLTDTQTAVDLSVIEEKITDNAALTETQKTVNKKTEDGKLINNSGITETQTAVDLSVTEENLTDNAALTETKADVKQEPLNNPPLTKSKSPVKQKFTYINPNIEIENETESPDIEKEEPYEREIIKDGRVTYIRRKKKGGKSKHKRRF